jgi:hypothetical protein
MSFGLDGRKGRLRMRPFKLSSRVLPKPLNETHDGKRDI